MGVLLQLREGLLLALARFAYRFRRARTVRLPRPPAQTQGPAELVVHLDTRDGLTVRGVRAVLWREWPTDPACLLVLIRYRRPPNRASRADAEVRSWAAAPKVLARVPEQPTSLLYLLDSALTLPDVTLRVVQVGQPKQAAAPSDAAALPTAWIIPHRGHAPWLAACLRPLVPQLGAADEALICLDETPTPAILALRAAFPRCWFGALTRPGVGPFVARQRAVERTTCPLLLFQDSDDVPTADRATRLREALASRQLDAVGSHELRLDYLAGRVVAVRFPLDASAALRQAVGHPALFPTLLMRRAALEQAGGFSTHLRFALDTQLLLRASFSWRIGNVDAFLYVRRRRADSLTTTPATALGSPAREHHRARWKHDFVAVQAGQKSLAASSLAVTRGPEYTENQLLELGDDRPLPRSIATFAAA